MTAYGIALTMVIVGAFGLGWHFGRAALTRRLDRTYHYYFAERPVTLPAHARRVPGGIFVEHLEVGADGHVNVGRPLYDQEQERG